MNLQKKLARIRFAPSLAIANLVVPIALAVAIALVVAIAFSPAPTLAQIVGGNVGGAIHDSNGA
ncbi:MAG: hypothetical protein ABSF75_01270, partial [Terracidiphilus sp.]